MSRSLSRWQAIGLALIVLTGLSGVGWGLYAVGQQQRAFASFIELRVQLRNLQGLTRGTTVRINGLPVGEVREIDLPDQPSKPFIVRLKVESRYQYLITSKATARVSSEGLIGNRTLEIDPGSPDENDPPVVEGQYITAAPGGDLNEALRQINVLLREVREGQGTLGKLLTQEHLYEDFRKLVLATTTLMGKSTEAIDRMANKTDQLLNESRTTLEKFQQTNDVVRRDAEAIRQMPIIGGYVPKNAKELLVRKNAKKIRHVLTAEEIFEPGTAIFTGAAAEKLAEARSWVLRQTQGKPSSIDVVVVAYRSPSAPESREIAEKLTQDQAQVIAADLKKNGATWTGYLSSRRTVHELGMGKADPPEPEPAGEVLPANRVEIVLFIP